MNLDVHLIRQIDMNDIPHDMGYVLGNGPSRDRNRKQYDGITYGCNSIHDEFPVDVLVVMDTWYQFKVIASGYPAEHECHFGGWNPMPIGVPPESLNPPHYDLMNIIQKIENVRTIGTIMPPVLKIMRGGKKKIMHCLIGNLTVVMFVG